MNQYGPPPDPPSDPPPGGYIPPIEPNIDSLPQRESTNTESAYSSEIDPAFEAKAFDKIKAIVKGNGVRAKDLELKEFKGTTLEFLATTRLNPRVKILDRTQAGKVTGPVQVNSQQQLQELIKKEEHKITHRSDVIKRVQDTVIERKDKGYGLSGQMIMLPFLYKEFVLYEACQTCRGNGEVTCMRCQGSGMIMCPACNGTGQIFNQQTKQQEPCNHCRGNGKIQCPVCKTKGKVTCKVCNGHGWNSHISRVEIDAMTEFDYDRENVEVKVGALVEKLGPELIEHADIQPIQRENEQKDAKDQRNYITVPYLVKLPNAEMRFTIKNNVLNCLVFGYSCTLTHVPNFLEKLIKPGTTRLAEAAQERGNVIGKIQKAGRYRTIRDAIIAAARVSPNKAMQRVKSQHPHAISTETIKSVVLDADKALKNATRKPRQKGLVIGLLAMFACYAAYFLTPIYATAMGSLSDPLHKAALDGGILIFGLFLAITIIKEVAKKTLQNALRKLVPAKQLKSFSSKIGKVGIWAYISFIPFFLICCEISVQMSTPIQPWWYLEAKAMLGL